MPDYGDSAIEREFILSESPERGVRTIGFFKRGDPRLHFRVEQEVPDGFFDENKEADQNWSPNAKRGTHYQRFASIPDILRQQWMEEFGVNSLFEDDDVKKKVMQRLNSREFYKLRTGGGNL